MALEFNRQKYLNILKTEGYAVAISTLHRDMERVEYQSFEGDMKFETELHRMHDEMRSFSRELWRQALEEGPQPDPVTRMTRLG
jgi:hypothetical protein